MSTTYTKSLKTLQVYTVAKNTYETEDGAIALSELEKHETVQVGQVLIPFHAIEAAAYAVTKEEVTKADPYGCDDGEAGSRLCEMKTCEGKASC